MYRIAVTLGEPAGVGSDLLLKYIQQPKPRTGLDFEIVAIGDPFFLEERARLLNLPLKLIQANLNDGGMIQHKPTELSIIEVPAKKRSIIPGQESIQNSEYLLRTLHLATTLCMQKEVDALCTLPINKAVINKAGFDFSGHTEFLAKKAGVSRVVMMLATDGLKVALATTHIPLKDVASAINSEMLEQSLVIMQQSLQKLFVIASPKIAVTGLNPHAGEEGYLGSEEIDIIIPVIKKLQQQEMLISGPFPADTLFTEKHLERVDAVFAMYHDQGLPVLKFKGFGRACNITLGLPFIRTSVDHGTAYDIAGTGLADIGSFEVALSYALLMAAKKTVLISNMIQKGSLLE